jgi:hypothetical protein
MDISEEKTIIEQFQKSKEVFDEKIFDNEHGDIMCKIHSFFGTGESNKHNCIGCNLNDMTNNISKHLTSVGESEYITNLQSPFMLYIMLLYLTGERIETIFKIIHLPEPYRLKHFGVLQKIKKWANFYKHPGPFVLCHHPSYVIESDSKWKRSAHSEKTVIDTKFVQEYYSSENKNNELFKKLANKKGVIVEVPDIVKLTTDFVVCLEKFVLLIENNEVFREILNDKSTLQDYFINEISTNME